jgi:hypothetical protein
MFAIADDSRQDDPIQGGILRTQRQACKPIDGALARASNIALEQKGQDVVDDSLGHRCYFDMAVGS